MFVDNCIPDFTPRRVRSRFDSYWWLVRWRQCLRMQRDFALNLVHDSLCFRVITVDHQPTRAFRNPLPDEHDEETESRADPESETPAEPDRKMLRIEQHNRGERADGCAKPIRNLDHLINPAAQTRRKQLIN